MDTLPGTIIGVLDHFSGAFTPRVWSSAKTVLLGSLLTSGSRTVTAALRVLGLQTEQQFQTYHRVLNRARWSSRKLSQILLRLLIAAFIPAAAPIVVGIDDTIERRRGAKIAAKGIYRDPVRSSHGHFVKASGLRWLSMQLLAPIPWAGRIWALPFLTVLAPSERYYHQRCRSPKKLTDWARQMLRQLRRWPPGDRGGRQRLCRAGIAGRRCGTD